jgi:hypothetical protein
VSRSLITPCAYSFRFGNSYPVPKLLKFFKLLGQCLKCLNAEIKSMQIACLDAVTHTSTKYKAAEMP